jgi:hypothetical protein
MGLIGGTAPRHLRDTVPLDEVTIRRVGHDMVIEAGIRR